MGAVKSLETLISDTLEFLHKYVDEMADGLKNMNIDFWNKYKAARVVKDLGGSHPKKEEKPTE